jgi:putative ABC transport system substrate-binding protein
MFDMKRRTFITMLGGAAAWPLAARAQQPLVRVIGFLGIRTPEFDAAMLAEFRQGLREQGYAEGTNVSIDFGGRGASLTAYRPSRTI